MATYTATVVTIQEGTMLGPFLPLHDRRHDETVNPRLTDAHGHVLPALHEFWFGTQGADSDPP
jgi:hypothetical protein